ncbi:10045_t:CDS:1 [Racocetra fulgida]|uniref:10045_t:CDS:1 n=1 Tax=Racocetra fulgida TaxID=60492 RepID=A0A9N9DU17_9GLOM|nr:10045_t:CDS:1 [Racocetra fulgida]
MIQGIRRKPLQEESTVNRKVFLFLFIISINKVYQPLNHFKLDQLLDPSYRCRWTGCMSLPFAVENDLYNHVFNDHINAEQERFECHWMGCRRFPCGVESRTSVIAHVKTHFPVFPDTDGDNRKHRGKSSKFKVLNKYGKNNGIISHKTHVSVDMNGDAIGIPLTASLILRNLSISRKNLQYFEAYEQELTELLANCVGLSKHLAETLSNLKSM